MGYFLGKGARVLYASRRHGRYVPNVVGDLLGVESANIKRGRFPPLSINATIYRRPRPAEDQDVLGHNVGVVVTGIRLFDEHTCPFHAAGGLVPDDVLMESPAARDQPDGNVERDGIGDPVTKDGPDDDSEKTAGPGLFHDLIENPGQPIQV